MAESSEYIRRRTAGDAADRESRTLALRSRLERVSDASTNFNLSWSDIIIEQPIGYGGFSQVFRVKFADHSTPEGGGGGEEQKDDNDDEYINLTPSKSYALKCLNPQTKLHTKSFKTGAVDLAIEGEILSRISHENVIKLHGIIGIPSSEAYMESDRGYFIVLDLLADTLSEKLDKYRTLYRGSTTAKHMAISAVLERISAVVMGVAKGMEYLHSQGVALRDLKPDNVGFDENGVVKIFDLGFAREEHTIRPTEVAGSLRYMAPEVARGQGSLLISDVYSFGVLMWEICTLEKPYKHVTSRDDFMQGIILEEWRHTTSKIPSKTIRRLIKECWQTKPSRRPTFAQIVKRLRVELAMSSAVPMATNIETTSPAAAATAAARALSTKVPNKGFGSRMSLKRTATWTSKKLTSGMSQSNLGILRPFRGSKSSLADLTEEPGDGGAAAAGAAARSRISKSIPTSSTGTSGADRMAIKTITPSGRRAGSKSGQANATFGTSSSSGQRMKNPLLAGTGGLRNHTISENPNGEEPDSPSKSTSRGMRRGMPSAPTLHGL